MGSFGLRRLVSIALIFLAVTLSMSAQTFTKLLDFNKTDGELPFHTSLVQGLDGNIYGTTSAGGDFTCPPTGRCGTLFALAPDGTIRTFVSFNGTDGSNPYGGLVQVANGDFFGTTNTGGGQVVGIGGGTVFKVSANGQLTTLHAFCSETNCTDGDSPTSGLLRANDGNFYGTTCAGGASNNGTIYKITPAGTLTTLHSFDGVGDGSCPFGALMQATNGNFYGATQGGGSNLYGTVFGITRAGTLTTLHTFAGPSADGAFPGSTLAQAADGSLYGTTLLGGACPPQPLSGCGTIFKITPQGKLITLYNFCPLGNPCADGESPGDGLIMGSDGNFYGTTEFGGTGVNAGTIFRITPQGTLTTLFTLSNTNADGKYPVTTLLQATDGKFYGTTEEGGIIGRGTIFSLDAGLPRFVKTSPSFGKVGGLIIILGTDLTGATSVSFNGTPATAFKVVSATQINVAVPIGATSGLVTVSTPTGTLTSNAVFHVGP